MESRDSPERIMREMDWNLLRTFVVLAQSRSVTDAANRLRLTQPSVSTALKRLEDRVGKRLIHRSPGRFELTEAGEVYTMGDEAYVKAVLDLIDPDGKFFTGEQIFTDHPCMPPSLYTAYIQPAPYQLHTISNRALYDDPFRYTRIHLQSYKQVSIASERAHKYSHVCI